jgi:hypothetical protein
LRIVVIPDTQCKAGIDLSYLKTIGNYIVEKQPDVVVHLGDHWDMPSLSSYDVGKKAFEGRRYLADVNAGNEGMDYLLGPLEEYNNRQRKNSKKQYNPRKVFLFGNHENRINRAINDDPKIEGVIGYKDLKLDDWETHDFLDVVVVSGIAFSHYFITGVAGRPCSTAAVQLNKKHMSCISGHQQGLQIASGYRGDGSRLTSVIAGSCYEHDEDYMGPQGNKHWRGIVVLNDVTADGEFDLMPVSLKYLKEKYT